MLVQVPSAPVSAQERQAVSQALLQQYPSTQLVEAHCVPIAHGVPLGALLIATTKSVTPAVPNSRNALTSPSTSRVRTRQM